MSNVHLTYKTLKHNGVNAKVNGNGQSDNYNIYPCSLYRRADKNQAMLNLLLLNTTYPVLGDSVDPDQLASQEAN